MMRKINFNITAVLLALTLLLGGSGVAASERMLIPGGMTFGVRLCCDGVPVVGLADVSSGGAKRCPARDSGIRVSDVIREIGGLAVSSAAEVAEAIGGSGGEPIELTLERDGKRFTTKITPIPGDSDGRMRTGLLIRDGAAGIGTVTCIDPETGGFSGLGHGICDSDSGALMPLGRGIVTDVNISGVLRGNVGAPGELRGSFGSKRLGSLIENTERGVYGIFVELPSELTCEPIPAAEPEEVHEGEAELLCTLGDDGIIGYRVRISDIDRSGGGTKNFVVNVEDERLIARTGGIVQGMSGSPLIQDGKLIGAVTHVLLNNPAKGYGIFIGNMPGTQD